MSEWHEIITKFAPHLHRLQPWEQLPAGWDDQLDEQIADMVEDRWFEHTSDFQRQVHSEARRIRVSEHARDLLAREKAAQAAEPFDLGTLGEILRRPTEPPHRVEGLIPSDASTLVVAQRKTGKTTLLLNLARCLLTGEDFLSNFTTRPVVGTVALLNYEVSAAQIARWADDVGVDRGRLLLVNLRGRRNPLPVPEDRAKLAEILRSWQVETLIVDPFGRAYTGKSQNDPGEVGSWLVSLDQFARTEVGAKDLILATHAGWDGERTRGSSALEDWADSIITLVRDKDSNNGGNNGGEERYLRAEGRDVMVEEDQLRFDPTTRLLSLAGTGNRKAANKARRVDSLVGFVVDELQGDLALSGYEIEKRWRAKGLSFQKGEANAAGRRGAELGQLLLEPGPRNALIFRLNPSPPRPPHTSPTGTSDDLPDLPIYKGRSSGDVPTTDLPEDAPLPLEAS
ncbi:AAA family ATPase [Nocardioides humi]|uniref:AAA family ATPase n=1 Tax=Nocardioides humi TaxID=449461 RepID=UPI001128DF7D|nr:AAA family ATPase [Nocardioides humi]